MRKYKTIWVVIFLIVVVGCAMTFSIQRVISRREGANPLETADTLQLDRETETAENGAPRGNVAAPGSKTAGQNLYGVNDVQAGNDTQNMYEYEAESGASPSEYLESDMMPRGKSELAESAENGKSSAALDAAVPETAESVTKGPGASYGGAVSESADESADVQVNAAAVAETAAASAKKSAAADSDTGNSQELVESQSMKVMISPLTGSAEAIFEMPEEVSYEDERDRLSERIADLEKRIADRWKDTDETMTAKMNTAEYERSMWEAEMAQTYSLLEEILTEENKTNLMDQQTQWTKELNVKASESASRYEGSTRENLEYIKACSTITKKRVLQLMNTYLDTLAENEKNKK
ncbi:MAG: hypothetical protein Q4E24_05850 [bacterium]|nr:hypothetical protein [bacterium]